MLARLAQSVEHGANNAVVTGSIPVVSNTPHVKENIFFEC